MLPNQVVENQSVATQETEQILVEMRWIKKLSGVLLAAIFLQILMMAIFILGLGFR